MADGSRSSLAENPREIARLHWARWVMPSTTDLIFLALLFALTFTSL